MVKQVLTIRHKQSGKSIPLAMYAYLTAHCSTFGLYGLHSNRIAMMVSGTLFIPCLLIYASAGSYRDGGSYKRWHLLFTLIPAAVVFSPYPELILAGSIIATCWFITQAPLEIWKKRDSGAVDPRSPATLMISSTFWTVYSVYAGDRILAGANTYSFFVMIATLILWRKYHPNNRR
jgi:uncharacterized protein with PQ loop repeat